MEPLIHFVVPFTAMALINIKTNKALPISLLALLPDLDALLLVYRSLSHLLLVLLVVVVPLLTLYSRFRLHGYLSLASMAVASHSILDVFTGCTPILWPLYGYPLWIRAELTAHIGSSPSLTSSVKLVERLIIFQPLQSLDAPLFTGKVLVLSALLLTPVLLKAWGQNGNGEGDFRLRALS